MGTEYVLDTHALLWAIQADPRLGQEARRLFADHSTTFVLPAIALAEATWIVGLKRTSIPDVPTLLRLVKSDYRIRVAPLDLDVVERAALLDTINEMHDRQIVATALALAASGADVRLITKDSDIAVSKLVAVVW